MFVVDVMPKRMVATMQAMVERTSMAPPVCELSRDSSPGCVWGCVLIVWVGGYGCNGSKIEVEDKKLCQTFSSPLSFEIYNGLQGVIDIRSRAW